LENFSNGYEGVGEKEKTSGSVVEIGETMDKSEGKRKFGVLRKDKEPPLFHTGEGNGI